MVEKRIFVGNLPWSVGFDKLKELFASYGEIEDAIVVTDKQTKKSRGFGFVTFKDSSSVEKAVAEMNAKNIEGREITVKEATPSEKKEEKVEASEEKRE